MHHRATEEDIFSRGEVTGESIIRLRVEIETINGVRMILSLMEMCALMP